MSSDRALLLLMVAGTSAYMLYRIQNQREDIRKTIQVIELNDVEFWQQLGELRERAGARA
jgi:hypothetical protein